MGLVGQQGGRGGRGIGGDDPGARQVGLEPGRALGQGLGVRVHGVDGVEVLGRGEQCMAHPAGDFGLDEHVVALEVVEALAHGALQGVFERHDAEIGPVPGHGREHVADGGLGQKLRRMPQGGHGREVGKRALRAEVGHALGPLEPAGGGKNLAVDGHEVVGGQGAGIGGREPGQDFLFAEGLEHGTVPAGLAPTDFETQGGAAVEQPHDLVVQAVDALAQFQEGFFQGARGEGVVCRAHVQPSLMSSVMRMPKWRPATSVRTST